MVGWLKSAKKCSTRTNKVNDRISSENKVIGIIEKCKYMFNALLKSYNIKIWNTKGIVLDLRLLYCKTKIGLQAT